MSHSHFLSNPQFFSEETFLCPDAFWGPVYAWLWNAHLDSNTIRTQIDEMELAGIRSIYIIPEPPEFRPTSMITTLSPDYLSDAFFAFVQEAFAYAESKGMIIWIYDEGGWPSGGACGHVTAVNPRVQAKTLVKRAVILASGDTYVLPEGCVAAFCEKKRIESGLTSTKRISIDEYYRDFINNQNLVDLTELGAVQIFLEVTHARYAQYIKNIGTKSVPCMFTDEPVCFMPAFPFDFQERFLSEFGYDITDYLYLLTDPSSASLDERPILRDYRCLVGKLFKERFFIPVQKWCKDHNMIFTGHLDLDHLTESGIKKGYGNPLSILRTLDMPGVDTISRQIFPDEPSVPEGNSFFVRMASSAAVQKGHLISMSESFAVYGNGLTGNEMRWISNYQIIRGIQIINPMLIPYGRNDWYICGERPYFCKEIPGFTHLKHWNMQTARTSYFMSIGTPDTPCALFFPAEEILADPDENGSIAHSYHVLGEMLEAEGVDFDIIDREGIANGNVSGGVLHLGFASYYKVYVPKGVYLEAEYSDKLALLKGSYTPIATTNCSLFRLRSRTDLHNNRLIMVFNQGLEKASGHILLKGVSACYLADTSTGELSTIGYTDRQGTHIDTTLDSGESLLLYCPVTSVGFCVPVEYKNRITLTPIKCIKKATFQLDANGMSRILSEDELPYQASFSALCGEDFSGEIAYLFSFNLNEIPRSTRLVLEQVEHSCEVRLNSQSIGFLSTSPYRMKIQQQFLRIGENQLEIVVANTAGNRFAHFNASTIWDNAHIGPYHPKSISFESERHDGGLYGNIYLETE